ncbi:MAG: LysR family transcriptional regulator [Clostridia bacterium]|nr:LysR family transcriptional regulator [Clostridia bacterium]
MFKNKEYVLAVYKEGSFTRAAEKLYVSQPSLSATVRRIEEKVGAPIFDRSTSPITLTDVGREYLCCAEEIERREAGFTRYIDDRKSLLAGHIRLGGSSFFSSFVIPGMISDFNELYPSISFDIVEDSTKGLFAKLGTGEVDLVIDNAAVADGEIISERYKTERLLLCVPRRIAEARGVAHLGMSHAEVRSGEGRREPIDLSLFRSDPFIVLRHENDTGRRAEALFRAYSIEPRIILTLDQQLTAYNISASGMGISFASDTLILSMQESGDLIYFELPEAFAKRSIYVYRKRSHYLPLASRAFIERTTGNTP